MEFKLLKEKLNKQIIAHRGAPHLTPENTLASFKMAKALNAKWVEFDIQRCGSGEWVVIHDTTLERTSNGRGLVAKTPYSVIKALDAGAWFHPKFKNESIPLFQDVLTLLQNLGLSPNIEIKIDHDTSRQIKEEAVTHFYSIFTASWPRSLPFQISSFDIETLLLLKSRDATLPLALAVEKIDDAVFKTLEQLKPFALHCNFENISRKELDLLFGHKFNREFSPNQSDNQSLTQSDNPNLSPKFSLTQSHKTNLSQKFSDEAPIVWNLMLYTINDKSIAESYFSNGVTAIFSDIPNLLSSSA